MSSELTIKSNAMQITLMRHGKPLLPKTGWIRSAEMAHWIENYNFAEIKEDDLFVVDYTLVGVAVYSCKLFATSIIVS